MSRLQGPCLLLLPRRTRRSVPASAPASGSVQRSKGERAGGPRQEGGHCGFRVPAQHGISRIVGTWVDTGGYVALKTLGRRSIHKGPAARLCQSYLPYAPLTSPLPALPATQLAAMSTVAAPAPAAPKAPKAAATKPRVPPAHPP